LTYSIIIPQTNRSHGADSALYQTVHQAIISALQTVGISATRFGNSSTHTGSHEPFLCFQRRTTEDLVVSGYKMLGSAQRRGGSGILQHGSLLLASSAAAPELPGLWNLTAAGAPTDKEPSRSEELDAFVNQLIQHISAELGQAWDMRWASGQLSTEEQKSALKIRENRFTAPSWNFKR
jgi:lipoate-protein ligase A